MFQRLGGKLAAFLSRQCLEHGLVGRIGAAFGRLLAAGKLQLVEQNFAELLGGAKVELLPGKRVHVLFERSHAVGIIGGEA